MCKPIDCGCCTYSFFSSEFSAVRKGIAGGLIVIGVALTIIFALGVSGVLPAVNTQYPNLFLVIGTVSSFGAGFALAGVIPPEPPLVQALRGMKANAEAWQTLGSGFSRNADGR